jgi:hypothetical protein
MKKHILSFVLLGLMAGTAKGGFILGTDYPAGSPLYMTAGSTSELMTVNVSGNTSQDIMLAWQINLVIAPENGASGTLTFQDPGTFSNPSGPYAPNPPNYVFGNQGFGINTSNTGGELTANDFDLNGFSGTGGNLLQMDFSATSNASGLFGIYALEGQANTVWTDSNYSTQLFTNVPDGTDMVLIGEVDVISSGVVQAVPEPSSLMLCMMGSATLAVFQWFRQRKPAVV